MTGIARFREACDTHQSGSLINGEYANEEVMGRCHPVVCNKGQLSTFYANHPTDFQRQCTTRDGEVVSTRRNVPSRDATNLCRQTPVIPSKCNPLSHGMLMNLQGADVPTLYSGQILRHRDELVARVGAGLFVHGGK